MDREFGYLQQFRPFLKKNVKFIQIIELKAQQAFQISSDHLRDELLIH